MSKAADMAKISVKGGFHVLWGLVTSTVISAVGTIILGLLLGEENYGFYAIAMNAIAMIVLFRDWGINFAIIRYTAQSNADGQTAKIRSIFMSGLVFEIVMGLALALIGFLLSDFLAVSFDRPTLTPFIQILSLSVLASALVSTATAAFTGVERMHFNSIMLVGQSMLKTGLIITLVVLGLGVTGAITGFTIAILLTGLIGVLFIFTIYKKLPKAAEGGLEIMQNIKIMLKYGVPLSIAVLLGGFLGQYYNFVLYAYLSDNAVVGNLAMAQNFVVLITFVATPVTTMLFPAFSKLNHEKDAETLQTVFQASVKYASLLVVPVTVMIMTLAQPAISTLFGNTYAQAPLYLALLAIGYLYTLVGNLSIGSLINGQGQTTFNLTLGVISTAVGLPLGFILISNYGVLGLIATTVTTGVPSIITALVYIKKRYKVTVNWNSSIKILISSTAAATITYLLLTQINTFPSLVRLIIGVVVFAPTYLIAAILTRAFNTTDINSLREMLTALGPLYGILNFFLNIIERLVTTLAPNKKQA